MLSRATIARWYQAVQGYRADPTIPNVPLAKYLTSAVGRCPSPSPNTLRPQHGRLPPSPNISHLPLADVHPPRQIHYARNAGVFPLAKYITPATRASSPLAKYITPATRASSPPRQIHYARNAGVFPPRHLWRVRYPCFGKHRQLILE